LNKPNTEQKKQINNDSIDGSTLIADNEIQNDKKENVNNENSPSINQTTTIRN